MNHKSAGCWMLARKKDTRRSHCSAMIVPEETTLTDSKSNTFGMEGVEGNKDLSQGDLIVWHDKHYFSPWRTYGIVVTADCDLTWGKHGGRISYIPAFTTKDYLWHTWRPAFFQQENKSSLETMSRRLNTWRQKNDGMAALISEQAFKEWFDRVGADQLLTELGVSDKGQRNTLEPIVMRFAAAHALIEAKDFDLDLIRASFRCMFQRSMSDPKMLPSAF